MGALKATLNDLIGLPIVFHGNKMSYYYYYYYSYNSFIVFAIIIIIIIIIIKMMHLTFSIYFNSIQGLCLLELVITGRKET